jgi:hypothetical protein
VSLESDVLAVLQAQCPRVYPSQAPLNTVRPFLTYDHLGGDALRYMDGTAANKRMAQLQVTVWAADKPTAITLMLAVEEAMCTAAAFSCAPVGALQSGYEYEGEIFRSFQEFSVLGAR